MEDEPAGLAKKLLNCHKLLVLNIERARTQAAKFYDKAVKEANYEEEERV